MIKYHKHTEFLESYIEAASYLVPLEKLKYVKAYKVPENKNENTFAVITRLDNKFSISIRLWKQTFKVKEKNRVFAGYTTHYLASILETLAHELAHLKYWKHTYEHFELTARIMLEFSTVLRDLKIKDTYVKIPTRRK